MSTRVSQRGRGGFTLVELMLTVTIVGLLASISIGEFQTYIMRARRTEAILGLSALWTAQAAFFADHQAYASTLRELDFEVAGGEALNATTYRGGRYTYQLTQPWGTGSFYCIATGQLDADAWPDIIEIYEFPGGD